ncbi:MAG TPA: hypothetical protein VM513_05825 [Kofleriaceae bacterium]|nr:hypothetical protein [Kofleriaceae bacterium]
MLVGGHAVSFWANYYAERATGLEAGEPYTSKDIDFIGPSAAVEESARRLHGTAKIATIDDANTPNTGVVLFTDDDGYRRQIDFLDAVAGVRETYYDSIAATIVDEHAAPIATVRVMDPISCLKARAYNVVHLPGYQNEHALGQLRAAILCAKEFVRDLLQQDPREALKANEHVFEIASYDPGPAVFVHYGIDVLEAVVDDPGLPEKFYTERWPRVRDQVDRARAKVR